MQIHMQLHNFSMQMKSTVDLIAVVALCIAKLACLKKKREENQIFDSFWFATFKAEAGHHLCYSKFPIKCW